MFCVLPICTTGTLFAAASCCSASQAPQLCSAGRGRQVIAVCKSADLLLMVLDASKPDFHKDILTRELESVGLRLNRCVAGDQQMPQA